MRVFCAWMKYTTKHKRLLLNIKNSNAVYTNLVTWDTICMCISMFEWISNSCFFFVYRVWFLLLPLQSFAFFELEMSNLLWFWQFSPIFDTVENSIFYCERWMNFCWFFIFFFHSIIVTEKFIFILIKFHHEIIWCLPIHWDWFQINLNVFNETLLHDDHLPRKSEQSPFFFILLPLSFVMWVLWC